MPHADATSWIDGLGPGIRAPLGVVKEFAGILHDGLAGPTTPEQRQYLRIIEQRIDQMERFVRNVELNRQLKSGMLCVTRRVCTWQDVMARVCPTLERRGFAVPPSLLQSDVLPPIFCDAERTAHAFVCLISHYLDQYPDQARATLSPAFNAGYASPQLDLLVVTGSLEIQRQIQADLQNPADHHATRGEAASAFNDIPVAGALLSLNFVNVELEPIDADRWKIRASLPLANPATLFPLYFARFVAQRGDRSHVSIVEVSGPAVTGSVNADVEGFVQQQVRRFDLVYPLDDSRWLIVAPTQGAKASALVRRLEHNWRSLAPGTLDAGGPLRVLHRGTWPIAECDSILRNLYLMTG